MIFGGFRNPWKSGNSGKSGRDEREFLAGNGKKKKIPGIRIWGRNWGIWGRSWDGECAGKGREAANFGSQNRGDGSWERFGEFVQSWERFYREKKKRIWGWEWIWGIQGIFAFCAVGEFWVGNAKIERCQDKNWGFFGGVIPGFAGNVGKNNLGVNPKIAVGIEREGSGSESWIQLGLLQLWEILKLKKK